MGTAEKRLRNARRRRRQVASEFTRLEKGTLTLHSVLEDPPMSLENVDIWDILRRAPKMGRAGAEKVLMKSEVWPHRKLRSLSRDDRHRIIQHLPPRAH